MAANAVAGPQGMTVVSGTAQMQQHGGQTTITTSDRAFLQWQSFNIGVGESTVFQQPSATSITWNRIDDPSPSRIFGSLTANGIIVLANSQGFYFGPQAFVQAAGLVVTTTPIAPVPSGPAWCFSGPPPTKPIINYGRLQTESGGSLYLIAQQIENHGSLEAPGGKVGLLGAEEVWLSERPDGLGLSARVRLPAGTVDNRGQIRADAGQVLLQAQTVNQNGLVQANSVREHHGIIEIYASEQVTLGANSSLQANGDTGVSAGGQIVVKSDNQFVDAPGSLLSANGGPGGGDAGSFELSGQSMGPLQSRVEASAVGGYRGGRLLIDPVNITLDAAYLSSFASANQGLSAITLAADQNITLSSGTTWDLGSSIGRDNPGCTLTLQAGNDLIFNNGSKLSGSQNWNLTLQAGGNVTLNGSAVIEAGAGNISIDAGNSVTVGSGAIRTRAGGGIGVTTHTGSVNTGSNPNGFTFPTVMPGGFPVGFPGYLVSDSLGGISTMAGGDVHITSGKDIVSFLPPQTGSGSTGDAGTGAFGAQAGNVTLSAAGDITGHYVIRNGIGTITAGGAAGSASRLLALSLIKGSWSVNADTILLQEVRNPNGLFNSSRTVNNGGTQPNSLRFLFDYAPDASVSLHAANQVVLRGVSLPRSSSGPLIPIVYPPTLSLEAGSGGVILGSDITLFPSATGNLSIKTTDGGSVGSSLPLVARYLTLSDSDKNHWSAVGDLGPTDHGNNALHMSDTVSASLDISGSVSDVFLSFCKPAEMHVGGDMLNSGLRVQNLHALDQTTLNVVGDIRNRNYFTFVPLATAPDFGLLDQAHLGYLRSVFVYRTDTHQLGFGGRMSASDRDALLAANIFDPAIVNTLHDNSQDVPVSRTGGFEIFGPGSFKIAARSMDLGVSDGIRSRGISVENPALIATTQRGADIHLDLQGDLDLFSSTIISAYGGNIDIQCAGSVDIGSQLALSGSRDPRGIVSLWKGGISIKAGGNIQVNGSRVAAYDGGNIYLRSENGFVNAGSGGAGYITVDKPYWDSVNQRVSFLEATIPGSGILATTFPFLLPGEVASRFGNITVETPRGDILASHGGIVQFALGPFLDRNATITLRAGSVEQNGIVHIGSIRAKGSGVIGARVIMEATGDIEGLVVASQNVDIRSQQNVNVTVLSQGGASISAAGQVSGTIASVGALSVSGDSVSAALVSSAVSASGALSGAAAAATSSSSSSTAGQVANQAAQEVVQAKSNQESAVGEDEEARRKKERALLAEYVGRVTVILP